jgi:Tol biopolymer transport system component
MPRLLTTLALISAGASSGLSQSPLPLDRIVYMLPVGGAIVPGPGEIYEIAVMNLDGLGFRQLTNDGTFKFLPHFSPDGTKLVYTVYSVGQYGVPNAVTDIAVYDFATGSQTLITHQGADVQGTWSPDGQRIAYLNVSSPTEMWTIDPDGSNPQEVASSSGAVDDMQWGDIAWSRDDWILFSVAQNANGCFKVRTDKIRPDGSSRTQVSDGGPNCTPAGAEQSGDADPGWSADSQTIYSSRGFPVPPADGPPGSTERKLYAFSSDAWYSSKVETDLSLPSEPSCIEGVPKGSPNGLYVLVFRMCFDTATPKGGIYLTDTAGSFRTFITEGFGADWAPSNAGRRPPRPPNPPRDQ